MIAVDSLLYKIDQKLNKLSTSEHQDIPLEDKILSLNEAQIKLVAQKVDGPSTSMGLGMDAFKKRYEDLQNLVEDYIDHKLELEEIDKNIHQWTASIKTLDPKYLYYVDAYILADKGNCKNRKVWANRDLLKHGDLQFVLNNDHYKPSFEYQETTVMISSDQISIFTDGTFTPVGLYLSYIRYPKYIDKEGYTKLDGNASVNQDCELKDSLENELVDLAVSDLGSYTENVAAVQSAQFRISKSE